VSKYRFFISQKFTGDRVEISGSDVRHIRKVLRLEKGDEIEVCDAEGRIAKVVIESLETSKVKGIIKAISRSFLEKVEVALFQALTKTAKIDLVIRQGTEIGVSMFGIFKTKRSVVKLGEFKAVNRVQRWQRIALEAAKQAKRVHIPQIIALLDWVDLLTLLKSFDLILCFWEGEKQQQIYQLLQGGERRIAVVIGPEGGFAEEEVADLKRVGALTVTLGPWILRTETAGVVAPALVIYEARKKLG
jgi:16S rRNA (uracil1498-N3)-methyltransferase